MSIALSATFMMSCSNDEGTVSNEVANEPQVSSLEMQNLQLRITEIADSMRVVAPANQTRGFWKWLGAAFTDGISAMWGFTIAGPYGAAVAASTGSALVAAFLGEPEFSMVANMQTNEEIAEYNNKVLLLPTRFQRLTANDSIGFYHNAILKNIGSDKLRSANDANTVYAMAYTSAKTIAKEKGINIYFTTLNDIIFNNPNLRKLASNLPRIRNVQNVDELCLFFTNLYPEAEEEIAVIGTYFKGMEGIDENQRAIYTKSVLNTVNNAMIADSTKMKLNRCVIVGNASSILWK